MLVPRRERVLSFKKMNTVKDRPVVGIPADRKEFAGHPFQAVGEKYVIAVLDGAQAYPVLFPCLSERIATQEILQRLDGILLTGSHSNVEPHHYQGLPSKEGTLHDPHRDATTLPLIRQAVDAAIPLLGICRGFQEMNVAFGGSLHQEVHAVEGLHDHREPEDADREVQYGPAHEVQFTPGGLLAELYGVRSARVNSLHSQGVDRLGDGLCVEARAADGLVEAFRVADAAGFALAVQWHPEWRVTENPLSMRLFRAFGDACREWVARRGRV